MSIKIGTGFGAWPFGEAGPAALWRYLEACELGDVDSIWLSERLFGPPPFLEPVTGVAMMAARTEHLKFGFNVLTLPVRDPLTLGRELATVDWLSGGRLLPAFGLGNDLAAEWERAGIPKSERAARTDEATAIMRRLWGEDGVTYEGRFWRLKDATLGIKPVHGSAMPIWFGGRSNAALRRVGRLGDGWLAASTSAAEVAESIPKVRAAAAEAGRRVDEDHYGVTLPYRIAPTVERAIADLPAAFLKRRPDLPPTEFGAFGPPEAVAATLDRYIQAGASKFVLVHLASPDELDAQLDLLVREVIPLYHKTSPRLSTVGNEVRA